MPRVKKEAAPAPVQNEGEDAPEAVQAADTGDRPSRTSVDIYQGETLIRTYSLENHGENFQELADQFIIGHPNCRKV